MEQEEDPPFSSLLPPSLPLSSFPPPSLPSPSLPPSSIASEGEHECNYKLLYFHLLEELAVARRDVEQRDSIISYMFPHVPDNIRMTLDLPSTITPSPTSPNALKSASLKSHPLSLSKYSPSTTSTSSSKSSVPLSSASKTNIPPPKPLTSKPLPPSSSSTSSTVSKQKSKNGLPPIDNTFTSFNFESLPDTAHFSTPISNTSKYGNPTKTGNSTKHSNTTSQSTNIQTTTTTTSSVTRKPSSTLISKPLTTSKYGKTTNSPSINNKTINSKTNSTANTAPVKKYESPTGNAGIPNGNRRLQVESDETYALILQDIEAKKARERGFDVSPSARRNLSASHAHAPPAYAAQFLGLFGEDALSTLEWNARRQSLGDEIGTSYEELSQLEDVCTGVPEHLIDTIIAKRPVTPSLESAKCPICLEGYFKGEEYSTLQCEHTFHYICIFQCLAVKKTCPLCKVYVM